MALSKIYTAIKFWNEAAADLKFPDNDESYVQRFLLMNRAINAAMAKIYDLFSAFYLTSVSGISTSATSGVYSRNNWMANYGYTYGAADRSIVFNSSPVGFERLLTQADVGKVVYFGDEDTATHVLYVGVIESVTASNIMYLKAGVGALPTTNIIKAGIGGGYYFFLIVDTLPQSLSSDAAIHIPSLAYQPMRLGFQGKMTLESSATTSVRAVGTEEFRTWSATAVQNKNTIVYTIEGDYILLKRGNGLSSFGTLNVKYPRLPIPLSADADYVDVPDGVAVDVCLLMLKQILVERLMAAGYPAPKLDFAMQYKSLVEPVYQSLGLEYQSEPDKDKLVALK